MPTESRLVGAGTVAGTFCGVLCRVRGGPHIIHGSGKGPSPKGWYEGLCYTKSARPDTNSFQAVTGNQEPKQRNIRISKLASLIQPAVIDASAEDITKISELVGEHTSDQCIRTDDEIMTCVRVGHKCVATVALCEMVQCCTTNMERLPKCSWRRLRHSPDLFRIQHDQGIPLQGLLQGGRQRRTAGPLGQATLRPEGLDGKACRKWR